MSARAVDEPHRVSSPLELLFDLTFVVAVAAATAQFAHGIAGGHGLAGLVPFLQVFFAIWWAWMNFTWFASSYDTDDIPYRLLTMVQMAGVLVLAAGVPAAAGHSDYGVITLGYFLMRIGLVVQWLRAGREDPEGRRTAFRYAGGITFLQVGWLSRLALVETGALPPSLGLPSFVLLAALEIAVPWWAERAGSTSWHPHHIAERYGLFTIILLGESVLAASRGVEGALEAGEVGGRLVVIAVAGLLLLFALWWLYFLGPAGDGLSDHRRRSYLWGYGHYGIFAALAALGAGLEVAVERSGHDVAVSPMALGYAVAAPVGVYLALLWAVNELVGAVPVLFPATVPGCVVVVLALPLAAPWIGVAAVVGAIAAVCVLLVAVTIWAANAGARAGAR
ncbi:low temperature requirement protein A [Streptosporangium sandarakinum]|uniref:Low temperature requirement protein LtrA n=1 Tax=Streptosporangium sandarakinum TaxID=1260955 RepID=A0A852V180_9ACTN|nr:low temperature requirement protein A [Streptosporangium sandarakinum]NYF41910.1 low temperature requirement protein LtrA [Streptosporangium sandarakinum]